MPDDVQATFAIDDVTTDPRTATITVTLDPATTLDDPAWVQITAWRGQGLIVEPLERTGEGTYRTTEPVPLHDDWKTLLRLHDGRLLTAVPIYLPEDAAIPADAISADDGMTRSAIPEVDVLQRERQDASPSLWNGAGLVVWRARWRSSPRCPGAWAATPAAPAGTSRSPTGPPTRPNRAARPSAARHEARHLACCGVLAHPAAS